MLITKGITVKLQVSEKDKQYLSRLLGMKRMIWNLALDYKTETYKTYKRRNPCVDNLEEKKVMNKMQSNSEIQKAFSKKELLQYEGFEFLADLPNRCMQQALNDLDLAFKNFFNPELPNGYPDFKRKHAPKQSIRFLDGLRVQRLNKKNIEIKVGRITFKGINSERNNKRLFDKNTEILSITIKKDNLDNVYASVCYSYEEVEDYTKLTYSAKEIGLDMGITDSVTTSDGEFYNLSKKLKLLDQKKKKLQRRNSKNKKRTIGSRSWVKTKKQIAKIYKQQINIRKDFHHKLSDKLTKTHGLIVHEDLKIKNMSKSAKGTVENPGKNVAQKSGLNREISNQGWGMFFRFLEYKGKQRGVEVLRVSPQGTSQICSSCDHKDPKSRNGKHYECTDCGHKDDADVNGAKNILTRGQRGIAGRENLIPLSGNHSSMTPELETTLLE